MLDMAAGDSHVLAVGIDWAEEFYDVALGRRTRGWSSSSASTTGPPAWPTLFGRCLALEPDPAEVRVVLETRHGLLVAALLDAGFTVLPVNPDLVARRRGPARKKDDAEDARICCLLALDRYAGLKTLIPHGELGGELRAIARDDERAARDQRRLVNRLRADLLAIYPGCARHGRCGSGCADRVAAARALAHPARAWRAPPARN